MNICMVCEDFLRYGGGRRHVERLSQELKARGHKITILTPKENGPQKIRAEAKVKPLRAFRLLPGVKSRFAPGTFFKVSGYDIVHSHSYLFMASLSLRAENFFLTPHGLRCSLNSESAREKILHKIVTEPNLRIADKKGAVICVSRRELDMCRELGLKNVHFIPNGIDYTQIREADAEKFREDRGINDLMVLEVSRLWKLKGQLRFLRDCAPIIRDRVDFSMVFIGSAVNGKYIHELREEALKHDIDIHILPDAPDEEVWRAYKASDVFILPSEFEGSPLVVHEAAAAGTPSVATDVGNFLDADEVGYCRLIPFWDPRKFANEIIKLLEDDELRRELGKKGLNKSKEMSWESMAIKVEEKYHEVLKKSHEG